MGNKFGDKIRELREKKQLYLRQVAPALEMDTAQLSKIEKGLRQIKRNQIKLLAKILSVEAEDLMVLWLSDKLFDIVRDEEVAIKAINTTINTLKFKDMPKPKNLVKNNYK